MKPTVVLITSLLALCVSMSAHAQAPLSIIPKPQQPAEYCAGPEFVLQTGAGVSAPRDARAGDRDVPA